MKDILAELTDQLGLNQRAALQAIAACYAEAVSPQILRSTRITAFRGGVLEVEVSAAPLLMELRLHRQKPILQALRKRHPTIREIRFRPARQG